MLDSTKATRTAASAGARVRAAKPTDRDQVCDLIERHFDGITRTDMQSLFDYHWSGSTPNYGLVIEAQGEVVGFVGTLYAERTVDGRVERFCNITSLCVDPTFRAMAPLLIIAAARQKDVTVTCLSPSPIVCRILEKSGFTLLDSDRLFVPPAFNLRGLAHGLLRFDTDPERIRQRLDEAQRHIMDDHIRYDCVPVLAWRKDRHCLLIVKKRQRYHVPVSEILYASDGDFLFRHTEAIAWRLLSLQRSCLLACSRRLFGQDAPAAMILKRKSFFRSRSVAGHQIDNLYSEFVLLSI